jgi:ubiquinone biosynthesis protein COQ9
LQLGDLEELVKKIQVVLQEGRKAKALKKNDKKFYFVVTRVLQQVPKGIFNDLLVTKKNISSSGLSSSCSFGKLPFFE